jgi:hypothetical protein
MKLRNSLDAAKQVLTEAAETERFSDLSDAERLTWMLERAFVLGLAAARASPARPAMSRQTKASHRMRRRPCASMSDQ